MNAKVWQHVILSLLLPLLVFGVGGTATLRGATAQSADATITIDATRPGDLIPAGLWGSNLTIEAPAAETVEHPTFVDASRQIGVTIIRWPGGNQASAYDWKTNELIKPGGRKLMDDRVDMARILQFVRDIGAELSITVNFGTMTAQDAADLVEFLNGPVDSEWGARRAALGFPDPINVRYFEIGNEENQPHMWYYSWTAENPYKYFFGGEEERRGFYDNTSSQDYDPVGAKGDFFKADGGPNQTYTLRFPPVRDVQVYGFSDRAAAESCLQTYRQAGSIPIIPGRCEAWTEVADLSTQPPDARVFTLDAQAGLLRFGDGVRGAMPPSGSYLLVEYTTYGHDGFLDFARAMRAAPSSVPIQIGAAVLPFTHGDPITESVATMQEIFAQMDFYVRHQYGMSIPVAEYGSYDAQRQVAGERVAHLTTTYDRVRGYMASIGVSRTLSIGVTEWNVFLNQDYWHINRTLEGGVIAAEWFIRLLNAGETAPVAYAEQFALHGSNLALIRSQTNYSIAPMGYVFQGFADWPGGRVISPTVTSPAAMAYDKIVPYVVATAALSRDGRTLRIAVVNNAEDTPLTAALQITGFTATSARLWRLSADRYDADNDRDPTNVVLVEEPVQVPLTELSLPPHSVTFVELQAALPEAHGYLPLLMKTQRQTPPTPTPTSTLTPTPPLTPTPMPTPTPTATPTGTVHVRIVGPEETVFDWTTDRCEDADIPDTPARAFRDARGRVQLIASHHTNRRMIGRNLNQLTHDCRVIMGSHTNPDPAQFDDYEWLHSPYTPDGVTVYALIHDEYHGHLYPGRCPSGEYRKCWYNAVTLARSEDGGDSYTHARPPTHLVASIPYPYEPDSGPMGVFSPSNIIYNRQDGYYYALLHLEAYQAQDWGTCVMRTADLADPTSWRAWDSDGYDVRFINPYLEPDEPPEAHVCRPVSRNAIQKMHESLTFNTYLHRFVLVGTAAKFDPTQNKMIYGVYVSFSDNLIDWTPRQLLLEAPLTWSYQCGDPNPIAYPVLLDPNSPSRNFETTGKQAYLYFTRFNYRSCQMNLDRDLVRVPVEFFQGE